MPYKSKDDRNKWFRDNWDRRKTLYELRVKNKQAKVSAIKSDLGCKICGEKDARCLDFHHVNSTEKDFTICHAVCTGVRWARIEEEIKKCEVLCANCHRKYHQVNGYFQFTNNVEGGE